MDETQKHIGESVRALSAAFGDRQEDLAKVLGLSQNTVSRKLRGLTRWSVGDVQNVANHYSVDPGQVLAGPRSWLGLGLPEDEGGTRQYHPDDLSALAA